MELNIYGIKYINTCFRETFRKLCFPGSFSFFHSLLNMLFTLNYTCGIYWFSRPRPCLFLNPGQPSQLEKYRSPEYRSAFIYPELSKSCQSFSSLLLPSWPMAARESFHSVCMNSITSCVYKCLNSFHSPTFNPVSVWVS